MSNLSPIEIFGLCVLGLIFAYVLPRISFRAIFKSYFESKSEIEKEKKDENRQK